MAGDLAGALLPRRAAPLPADRPLKVLVANMAHLGDLIVMAPLLAALRSSSRTAKLGLVVGTWGRPVLELDAAADAVHIVDHWRLNRAPGGLLGKLRQYAKTRSAAVSEIRALGYDAAIDPYAYFGNSADLLWSAGIPSRIGFTSGGAGTLYTHRIHFRSDLSIAANQARLLAPILGEDAVHGPPTAVLPGFRPDPDAEQMASAWGDYMVLHIGPGHPHRDWPADRWIALGQRLIADGFRLVFTGAANEAAHGAPVRAALGGEDLLGRLSLRQFATILSRARGLVAIDTVAGHLAACFQTPTAVVFAGVVPPQLWRPSQPFARIVTHGVPCAPCHRTLGCAVMTCLRSVQAETVHRAIHDAIRAKAAS